MAVVRALLCVALAGCVVDDRALVDVPMTLEAASATPPADLSALTFEEAHLSVADLALLEEDDRVAGAWAGLRPIDLLAPTEVFAVLQVYEGSILRALFAVQGVPSYRLVGTATRTDGEQVPFAFTSESAFPVGGVVSEFDVDAEAPPSALRWSVDLAAALVNVDWRTPRPDGEPLTNPLGDLDEAIAIGLQDPTAWALVAEPGTQVTP